MDPESYRIQLTALLFNNFTKNSDGYYVRNNKPSVYLFEFSYHVNEIDQMTMIGYLLNDLVLQIKYEDNDFITLRTLVEL